MAINFPTDRADLVPALPAGALQDGDQTTINNVIYQFEIPGGGNQNYWRTLGGAQAFLPLSGGTLTGELTVGGDVTINDTFTLNLSDGTEEVSLGVDNVAANYEVRFPNAAATAANQILRTTNNASPFLLEWADEGGGAATSGQVVQVRAFQPSVSASVLSTTNWFNWLTTAVNFTPVSTNSTIIVDAQAEIRQNNVLNTNIQVNNRVTFAGNSSIVYRQSVFSNTGGDGGVANQSIRGIFANTQTVQSAITVESQMNQAAGTAICANCSIVVTEVQN